jgi:hypothetical protein
MIPKQNVFSVVGALEAFDNGFVYFMNTVCHYIKAGHGAAPISSISKALDTVYFKTTCTTRIRLYHVTI